MKMKLYSGVFLLAATVAWPQTNRLTALLQQGLLEEQASRNMDAAIADYQSLARLFDQDRPLAATAVFRLGECYRAQGRTNEAAAQYQRILRDFADQSTLAALSRQDLAGLGLAASGARKSGASTDASGVAPDATDSRTLATQIAGIEKLSADGEEQARAVLGIFPDDALKAMLLRLPKLQAQAARMESNPQLSYADLLRTDGYAVAIGPDAGSPPVEMHGANLLADARGELGKQRQWLAERVTFILGIQRARLKALQAAAGSEAGPGGGASEVAYPLADDESREIQRIERMIQNSPDLINAPRDGSTPLAEAAYQGWLQVAAYLLEHGAGVNVASPDVRWTKELADAKRVTPLLAAVAAGNKAMTRFLIDRRADIDAKDLRGDTALHLAARKGFLAVVEALLAGRAEVDAQDRSGNTPLFLAVQSGQIRIVQRLLSAGANANHLDANGRPALNYALGAQPEILAALLAAGANPNTEDVEGRTPLSYAVERSDPGDVKQLLAARADPNGGKLDAPLLVAIKNHDAAGAELLLEAGANPNRPGLASWNVTVDGVRWQASQNKSVGPLYFATTEGLLPLVRLLLQHHADPNDVRTDGQSMLFSAWSETNILAALLEAGADVEARRSDGENLLDQAVERRNVTAVRLLLKFKADPNHSSFQGRSCLFSALSETNILAALLDAGAVVDPVSKEAANRTPLGMAVKNGSDAAVLILLEHGANPNVRDADGNTPLHAAAYGRADRIVFESLLAHKADPNVRNNSGETPLDVLTKSARQPEAAPGFRLGLPPGPPWGTPRRPTGAGLAGEAFDSRPSPSAGELAAVLREHGALDKLPNWDCITVSRPAADFSFPIFHRGSNDWNQFTLLEAIFNFFRSPQTYSVAQGNNTWSSYPLNAMLPFADLARVTVVRPARDSTNGTRQVVNLLNRTNGLDVSQDVPLQFGDVVEIPERDHALDERAVGLTEGELAALTGYATATVQLVTHGQKVELVFYRLDGQAGLDALLNQPAARKLLLASSDLARVKVTRRDPRTGRSREWVLDCRPPASVPANGAPGLPQLGFQWNSPGANNAAPPPGLWLRDGDVVEVPEKP